MNVQSNKPAAAPSEQIKQITYGQLKQENESLKAEVDGLHARIANIQGTVDYQHAVIVNQQPTMAHLQWEASKWQHYKRILEAKEGKSAVAEAESLVQQRMAGLI